MSGRVQRIDLGDGNIVHARVSAATGYGSSDRDVGVADGAVARLEQLDELISRVGGTVLRAAAAVKPHEASVTFGVELTAKPGKAIAILADGEAKASVQVTLVWQLGEQAPEGPAGTDA
ncbi:hypothetical protein OH733_10440 [Streptomyces griseus]|uniref:CU044_2847 family protein n=1 Tax=Streptomyces TaxID=1883 RepID=UPI000A37584D|nr:MULTISPECIES: CU044_2847 family protein [Streptomyces]MCX4711614.1 CU044_2847 family protein [Streptomyces griseus]MDX3338454.1 CU044_2847 family protein [Streptomyces sp. ME02-6979.5a]QXQ99390.1 hypothetical protein KV381_25750 [Streptomyces sp. WY228]WTC87140.1 hypothetical protein OH733_10440 [Streptomyces griseus]WTD70240.1 hypothetical protein OH763_26545 [Streptomyces griseus]